MFRLLVSICCLPDPCRSSKTAANNPHAHPSCPSHCFLCISLSASAAQLLHFGLLKVCLVADSCCSSCISATSSSAAPFSPATTTSSAASAAGDIQLAVTVLATAVQYLEATHSAKQADAAAPQVLPGPRASLQVQQQALLQSGKKVAAAQAARRSTGGARQLPVQPDVVQLFNSTAIESTAGLAGNVPSSSAHTSNTYTQQHQLSKQPMTQCYQQWRGKLHLTCSGSRTYKQSHSCRNSSSSRRTSSMKSHQQQLLWQQRP